MLDTFMTPTEGTALFPKGKPNRKPGQNKDLDISSSSPSSFQHGTEMEDKLQYVWTRDPKLLLQYFEVREKCYKEYLHLRDFSGHLDGVDLNSHILLALDHRSQCVGGARLTVSDSVMEYKLPMETNDFRLADVLPELDLKNNLYSECSRVILLDQYRTGDYSDTMYRKILEKCMEIGVRHYFAIAPLPQSRRTRRAAERLGVTAIIRDDILIPDLPIYEGIRMHLLHCVIPVREKQK